MRSFHNIEKCAFPQSMDHCYTGYGQGAVWRVFRRSYGWLAVTPGTNGHASIQGRTLADLSVKLAGGQ